MHPCWRIFLKCCLITRMGVASLILIAIFLAARAALRFNNLRIQSFTQHGARLHVCMVHILPKYPGEVTSTPKTNRLIFAQAQPIDHE